MSEPSKLNVEIYGHIYTLRVTPGGKGAGGGHYSPCRPDDA